MRFYIAKGLQVAGFLEVGWALFAGIGGQASLGREAGMAVIGIALFYSGRLIDS